MYKLIEYLKHLLTATNEHGVHSPFVYAYVTKCLYAKSKYKASKCEKVALKSIIYFKMKGLKIMSSDSRIEKMILKNFGLKTSDSPPHDFIYSDNPLTNLITIHKEQIQNNSMLLVAHIHNNKSNSATWEALKQNEAVTVSVDLFYCGALFFRKEQVKEHFKIRI